MKSKTASFLIGAAQWGIMTAAAVGLFKKGDSVFRYGNGSEANLGGVNPALVRLARRALELSSVDFGIADGTRTAAEHARNLKSGASTTARSSHLDGLAIDVKAVGPQTDAAYFAIARAFREASEELGIGVRWGGSWKPLLQSSDIENEARAVTSRGALYDPGHFELWPKRWAGDHWEWSA